MKMVFTRPLRVKGIGLAGGVEGISPSGATQCIFAAGNADASPAASRVQLVYHPCAPPPRRAPLPQARSLPPRKPPAAPRKAG